MYWSAKRKQAQLILVKAGMQKRDVETEYGVLTRQDSGSNKEYWPAGKLQFNWGS